jgi:hypothetical protein
MKKLFKTFTFKKKEEENISLSLSPPLSLSLSLPLSLLQLIQNTNRNFHNFLKVRIFAIPTNQPNRCNNFPSFLLDVYVGSTCRPDHDQQHCYNHAPTVKPEAATAVVELLMMGVRTPETL